MKFCLIGNTLSNLVLAKLLLNKKIRVDLLYKEVKKKQKDTRTIGISKDNIDFLNKNLFNLKKICWDINEIKIFNEIDINKELLNFESLNTKPFSILKYNKLYEKINYTLNKEKNFNKYKIKEKFNYKSISKNKYDIIINSDLNNEISINYFFKRIKKNYNSTAYTILLNHNKCANKIARQIFTKIGPLAFLPISNISTSVVFSIFDRKYSYDENQIKNYIIKYNNNYKIKSFTKFEKFKLKFSFPRNYFYKNILLFGDGLHQIHPLAGQGFNMTLRNIRILGKIIDEQLELGLPLDYRILKKFELKAKHLDFIFASGIDFIHEFFKLDNDFENIFSKKIFKLLGKNRMFNKYTSLFANKGINF